MDFSELRQHLNATKDKFNVMNIFDKSGYSPIHYAAYKNIERACEVLIEFILQEETTATRHLNGGSGETADQRVVSARSSHDNRKAVLKEWLNGHSRGDDGFTALHFGAFHGNMSLIRLLVKHGADVNA